MRRAGGSVVRALAIVAAACARTGTSGAPSAARPAPAEPARSSGAADSSAALPPTPSGLERFVPAVAAPADTVGRCGTIAGAAFGEPALRGITWTVSPAGGPARHVLLLIDSTGSARHYSDIRGTDPRTEIAVNLGEGIGTATNYQGGKATARVVAPASAMLAATSLGNGMRVARRVLAQCPLGAPR